MNKTNRRRRRVRKRIFERDGNRCLFCGSTENLTIDHILPRAHGGTNRIENLRTLCKACNQTRGSEMPWTGRLSWKPFTGLHA